MTFIFPRSYLSGLTLSTAGSSSTFGVDAGQASDSTNAAIMNFAAAYTKTTGAWAVGSGNGALDTGTIAASSWYWAFLIERTDTGVVDLLITKAVAATTPVPTLPSPYSLYRYIGSMKTNASSQWTSFSQIGDDFLWTATATDFNGAPSTTAGNLLTLSVSPGIIVTAKMRYIWNYTGTAGQPLYFLSPNGGSAATGNYFLSPASGAYASGETSVLTNTSSQIIFYASVAGTAQVASTGWTDTRGRDA